MKATNFLCPACGASSAFQSCTYITEDVYNGYGLENKETIVELKNHHPIETYSLVKCSSCGLECAQPFIAPSSDWYGILYNNLKLYPGNRWEYDFVLKNTSSGTSVCDIGCGSGLFLECAIDSGFKATGFDFSMDAVTKGRSNGFEIHHLEIDNLQKLNHNKYDTVVAFQVLEHLEVPSNLFNAANALGNDACSFWISVPSDYRPSRVFSEIDVLDLPPHHMTHWTESSLRSLGAKNGWTMSSFYYEPISLKQIVWNKTIRSSLYRTLVTTKKMNKWLERFIRFSLYLPFGLVALTNKKMSGFSMLAKFERE